MNILNKNISWKVFGIIYIISEIIRTSDILGTGGHALGLLSTIAIVLGIIDLFNVLLCGGNKKDVS